MGNQQQKQKKYVSIAPPHPEIKHRTLNKKILLLDLDDKKFYKRENFCLSNDKIPFDIVVSTTFEDFFKETFYAIVAYTEDIDKAYSLLDMIAITPSTKSLQNISLFVTVNSSNYIRESILKEKNIENVKIYNCIFEEKAGQLSADANRVYRLKHESEEFRLITFSTEESMNLECQPWFEYFISRISSCGKGKLIQISGTCYLNTVINGLLLSVGTKNLLINAVKASNDPEIFKDDIITLACPLQTNSSIKYFVSKLAYHILCKKETIKEFDIDIMKYWSETIFSLGIDVGGGYPLLSLFQILYSMSINFGYLYSTDGHSYDMLRIREFPTLTHYKEWDKNNLVGMENYTHGMPPDIIVTNNFSNRKIEKEITLGSTRTKYHIQFAALILYFLNENDPEGDPTSSHAVVGIFCNDYPVIFDSNVNWYYHLDWTDIFARDDSRMQSSFEKKVIKNFLRFYPDFDSIEIEFCVYAKSSILKEHESC